jgi:hypothetical protein
MVSVVQGELASGLREVEIPVVGFHDGFQPPGPESISLAVAGHFAEIWVPSERVRDGYQALGFESTVVGQPSLESWRRTAERTDPEDVRRRQGVSAADRVLLFAGQYGPGYREVLRSFLEAVRGVLGADPGLILVLSPHPRTDGSVEREVLRALDPGPRVVMSTEGLSTMDLAVVAEAVLTWASTVGTQAAFMGKEVVYFSPPEDFDSDLIANGTANQADRATLEGILERILQRPRSPGVIRQGLVAGGYVVDADSVVAERIQAAILR